MTTLEMEICLMRHFDIRQNLIVPCVTDLSLLTLFEIDLLVLSKSSYATAIEIKVSKADLKNDLKKNHISRLNANNFMNGHSYRDHYFKNLKYFYYAVPEELKDDAINQIPDFAGLLICKKVDWYNNGILTNRIIEVRKPHFLYSTKWTDKMRYDLARLGTMRILNLKQNINQLKGNCKVELK